MSEQFLLPSPESLEALELAVSRNNTSVASGARVGEIQNPPIRFIVEQELTTEQSVFFADLVEIGSTMDWAGILAAERHARQELEAAAELSKEAKANASAQTASLEQSLILGIELAPSLEDKIRESADSQRQDVERDLTLPAEELEAEKAQLYARIEEMYLRAGKDWSIPNLVEIPREIAPGRYPSAEESTPEPYSGPSSSLLAEADLTLSEREQRMLDVILLAVSQGAEFRHATVDTGLADLGIFDQRSKQQHAFGRLVNKLIGADILEPRGHKGGRSYILLKGLVPHPEEDDPAPEPTAPSQPASPEPVTEQPVATAETEEEPPQFRYLKSLGGSRKGFVLAEGAFDEMRKRIGGGKDRRLAPVLEEWINWLFQNPQGSGSIVLLSNSPAIRVTVNEETQTARLHSFSPKDVPGLEVPVHFKKKRIIFALLADSRIAIQKVVDQHQLNSGRYSSKKI